MRFVRSWPLPAVTLLLVFAISASRRRRAIVPGSLNWASTVGMPRDSAARASRLRFSTAAFGAGEVLAGHSLAGDVWSLNPSGWIANSKRGIARTESCAERSSTRSLRTPNCSLRTGNRIAPIRLSRQSLGHASRRARVLTCSVIMPSWSDGEGGGPVHAALANAVGHGTLPGIWFAAPAQATPPSATGAARPGSTPTAGTSGRPENAITALRRGRMKSACPWKCAGPPMQTIA